MLDRETSKQSENVLESESNIIAKKTLSPGHVREELEKFGFNEDEI